jgi:16S rRNA (uracil1498-N3)-methyltransferase
MPRIFLPDYEIRSGLVTIQNEKARYLTVVLRCRPGDSLTITDGLGATWLARIVERTPHGLTLDVLGKKDISVESPLSISLIQGLLKGTRMDLVIQKATELGVKQLLPAVTERSQVRETRKLGRWKKIAEEAARQSGRTAIPVITEPAPFHEILRSALPEKGILFWERGGKALRDAISQMEGVNALALFTGPEGGFTEEEVGNASARGFLTATLGRRILRAETAAVAAVSVLQYALGDLG